MRRAHRTRSRAGALAHWDLHYGPNMTPMVDVVMVILVFFMASTAVLGPEWFLRSALPVNKPKAAVDPGKPDEEVRVEAGLALTMDWHNAVRAAPTRFDPAAVATNWFVNRAFEAGIPVGRNR